MVKARIFVNLDPEISTAPSKKGSSGDNNGTIEFYSATQTLPMQLN